MEVGAHRVAASGRRDERGLAASEDEEARRRWCPPPAAAVERARNGVPSGLDVGEVVTPPNILALQTREERDYVG